MKLHRHVSCPRSQPQRGGSRPGGDRRAHASRPRTAGFGPSQRCSRVASPSPCSQGVERSGGPPRWQKNESSRIEQAQGSAQPVRAEGTVPACLSESCRPHYGSPWGKPTVFPLSVGVGRVCFPDSTLFFMAGSSLRLCDFSAKGHKSSSEHIRLCRAPGGRAVSRCQIS